MNNLHPVLSASGMRAADTYAIDELGLGGFTLMETAGRAVADAISDLFGGDRGGRHPSSVHVFCGKGNNGGDGFVAARYLADRGWHVRLTTTADRSEYAGEAADHLEVLLKAFPDVNVTFGGSNGTDVPDSDIADSDIVVDALLGTGLSSEVREPAAGIIRRINASSPAAVVAVDIPSGIDSDTGRVLGCAVRADVTVTMAAHKIGLLLGEGPDHSGRVLVADIGIPNDRLDMQTANGGGHLSRREWACARLPKRDRSDHKYSTGPTLVVGGSPEYPGAAVLSARAAARIGSGYVVACGPESIREHLFDKLTEIPVAVWPDATPKKKDAGQSAAADTDAAAITPEHAVDAGAAITPEDAVDALVESLGNRWDKARALLVGPGLGRSERTGMIVKSLLSTFDGIAVIDADALYLLRDERDWVRDRSNGRWILTPHMGEFQRLLNRNEGIHDRMAAVRDLAESWNVTVLLKGLPSLTAAPGNVPVINATGNPAAGTAGTGDVLAGIVAGLAAQGLKPFEAAAVGVHLAGEVADQFVEDRDERSMIAGDVIDMLPSTLADLCRTE